jgi:riboflavin kinase/FMN adenylyltransferase
LVAIGKFDGVHAGHRAVIDTCLREASERRLDPVVLTFHPHPAQVLGRKVPPALTSLERKVELIARQSPELRVVVEPFTLDFASKSPREFCEGLLVGLLGAKVVIVGENFRFGRDRSGDFAELKRLAAELGFEVRSPSMSGDEAGFFSSTRIRNALSVGNLATAERLLGRPHAVTGCVSRGDGRGRTIGVPTANLVNVEEALPPNGVYASVVDLADELGSFQRLGEAVVNIGVRPTVNAGFSVEAHVLDLDADLYDRQLRLHLCARLRDEQRFSGLDALKAQIATDIQSAREILKGRVPDPRADGAWY